MRPFAGQGMWHTRSGGGQGGGPDAADAQRVTVNAAILNSLGTVLPEVKVQLFAVLADRHVTDAVAPLIVEARDGQPGVRVAAWRALGKVAQQKDLPAADPTVGGTEGRNRPHGRRAGGRPSCANDYRSGTPRRSSAGSVGHGAGNVVAMLAVARVGRYRRRGRWPRYPRQFKRLIRPSRTRLSRCWPGGPIPQAADLLLDLLKRSPNPTHRAFARRLRASGGSDARPARPG